MLAYWSQPLPGRPGSPKEAMAVLMPPDLQDYKPFVDFRNGEAAETPPGGLQDDIAAKTDRYWVQASGPRQQCCQVMP